MVEQDKGREFEIAAQVAELIDTLRPEEQKQLMALLAARYGLTLKEPNARTGKGYMPRPRKTKW